VWGGQIELEAIQACKLVICLLLGEKDREWQLGADFHDNNRSSKGNIQYHPSHWLNIFDILKIHIILFDNNFHAYKDIFSPKDYRGVIERVSYYIRSICTIMNKQD
jgi:hypothetical protein